MHDAFRPPDMSNKKQLNPFKSVNFSFHGDPKVKFQPTPNCMEIKV